jgi:acetate kinase
MFEPNAAPSRMILTINAGSSSLKIALYDREVAPHSRAAATIERIGGENARLTVKSSDRTDTGSVSAPDFETAFQALLDNVSGRRPFTPWAAGHRIVHGGADYSEPSRVSPALLADLRNLEPLDRTHMPQALSLIDSVARRYPGISQLACFDTTFHRTMPPVAQQYPLPARAGKGRLRRYGFHGLSCESIMATLRSLDPRAADGRILIAHLGNGASITAVRQGKSVDTTMGFSPTGGLMMGTRSGDLDPTVMTHLARSEGYDAPALEHLVNEEAGLLGVSGVTADMRDLLSRTDDEAAEQAIALYCYTARKHAGALAAVLNGVETLVFTGGIGEHAAPIRARICAGLGYLGVQLDSPANEAHRPVISLPASAVTVRVMQTDEDLVIAEHVRELLT